VGEPAGTSREADFSGRILCGACNCAASSNESSYTAGFRRAFELGLSESQLNRGSTGRRSCNQTSRGQRRWPWPECAEHVRQLEGESPFHNLMEVK